MPRRADRRPSRPVADDNPNTASVLVRLPPDLLEALDTWVARLNTDRTGPRWTRNDVIRAALVRAVKDRGERGDP